MLEFFDNAIGFLMMAGMAYLLYCAVACLIKIKEKLWCKFFQYVGCWMLGSMIIYMGDFWNLPPTLGIFLLCIWFCCKGSGLKKLTVGLMFASTIFAFNGFRDNIIVRFICRNGLAEADWLHYEYPLTRLLFAFILYLGIRHHKTEPDFELSKELWKLLFLLTVPSFGIVVSLIIFRSEYSMDEGTMLADGVLFLIVIVSFMGLIRAVLVLEYQQKLERENRLAEQNERYYEALEGQQFEIRRLKHDLANHLQVLLTLTEEKRVAYIEGMLDNPAFVQVLAYSGDATVNAVLTAKESLMRQKEIPFYAKIEIPKELPFEKADVCALFANALDNVAEACEKLPADEREVNLTARVGKGMLVVCVRNPYAEVLQQQQETKRKTVMKTVFGKREEELVPTEALPHSTKKDATNHGFGLRSIREVIKKYEGNMEITRENGQFTLFLYLPLPSHAAPK